MIEAVFKIWSWESIIFISLDNFAHLETDLKYENKNVQEINKRIVAIVAVNTSYYDSVQAAFLKLKYKKTLFKSVGIYEAAAFRILEI